MLLKKPKKRSLRSLSLHEKRLYARMLREEIQKAHTRPCADCKNVYLKQHDDFMTFDHLDPRKKKFDIGGIGFGPDGKFGGHLVTLATLRKEIAKTEVVCRTCHDRRERKRLKAREARKEREAVAQVFARVGDAFARAYGREIAWRKELRRREDQRRKNREMLRIAYNRAFGESWVLGCRFQAEIAGYALGPLFGREATSRTYVASIVCWIVRRSWLLPSAG